MLKSSVTTRRRTGPPGLTRLRTELRAASDDQERQLNLIRDAYHGAVFRLLMADLDRRLSTVRLADQLSALADAVIEVVLGAGVELSLQKV